MRLQTALLVASATLVMGCTASNMPSSGPGAGQLPPDTFPLNNARVVTQSGVNTATVEVTRGPGSASSDGAVRRAAREWCGGDASATPIVGNRGRGITTRTSYLVRCL